jgi:tetratricopeptide (TPR) repeat protein
VDKSHYNAAVIWDALGSNLKAINNYESYFKTNKKMDRREALFAIAQIQENRGALSLAINYYQQYLDSNSPIAANVILANFKIATISKRLNRPTKAKEGFQKTIAVQKKLSGGKGLGASEAAESRFELAQETLRELETLRIPANPAKQGEVVKRKLDLVTKLNNEMAEVIKYDDGHFVVAALTTAGRAYDYMSRALYDSPKPAGFNAEEMKLYNAEIDKIAAPLRQTAIDNYRRATSKSAELQVYNKWALEAMAALNRYDKSQFPETGERVLNSREIDMGL